MAELPLDKIENVKLINSYMSSHSAHHMLKTKLCVLPAQYEVTFNFAGEPVRYFPRQIHNAVT